ncbi:MAG: iron uptake porin, partial [Cyanobacteria bacterium J06641_5]
MFALLEPGLLQQSPLGRVVDRPVPILIIQSGSVPDSSLSIQPGAPGSSKAQIADLQPSNLSSISPHATIPAVAELAGIQSTDWRFQALQALEQRLGRTVLPEGRLILTRYEFAVVLHRLLDNTSAQTLRGLTPEDLGKIRRLQTDFETELLLLGGVKLSVLEGRVEQLEDRQFSSTAQLSGEVIVGLTGTFGNDVEESEIVLQQRLSLNLTTSFTGNDRLRVGLRAGNFEEPSVFDDLTNEGRLGFRTDTGNDIELSSLSYRFSIGDRFRVFIAPRGDNISALNPPFRSRGTGAVSRFGRGNPIYRLIGDGGIGLTYNP